MKYRKTGFLRAYPLLLVLLVWDVCAAQPTDLIEKPPHVAGSVSLVQGDRLVVGDRSMRFDEHTRIENRAGVIQAVSEVQAGKSVAIYLRQSSQKGTVWIKKLILLK